MIAMNELFKRSTYASQYDSASDVPDDIIQNNAAACINMLHNRAKFPKADWQLVQADYDFLRVECVLRGLSPQFNHGLD